MKSTLFILILLLVISSWFFYSVKHPKVQAFSHEHQITKVYICDGTTIGKFHYKKDCRGLNTCSDEIK